MVLAILPDMNTKYMLKVKEGNKYLETIMINRTDLAKEYVKILRDFGYTVQVYKRKGA